MLFRLAVAAAVFFTLPAQAQSIDSEVARIRASEPFRAAEAAIDVGHARFVDDTIAITQIPAPPFKEAERAKDVAKRFRAAGLGDVTIDAAGNVTGLRAGSDANAKLVTIAAHLDTVFPEGTDVTVKRQGTRLAAPGVGDDSRGIAALIAFVRALDAGKVTTRAPILFVADVGEEGRGNLSGMRHLFTAGPYKGRIGAFISMDGTGINRVVNAGIGSRRYHVVFRGPGGHSWGAFGVVNPMTAMAATITGLYKIVPPRAPRTSYSASVIGGGTSINAIPAEVFLDVDMRSESTTALATLERQFLAIVRSSVSAENATRSTRAGAITADPQLVGDRPAGRTAPSDPLVQAMTAAVKSYGYTPGLESSSTDANFPMELGIPAITIGSGGTGGRAHAPDEWIDVAQPESGRGLKTALLGLVAAAGLVP